MEYIPRVMYQLQRSGFKLSFCVLQLQHTTTRAAVWALTVALIGKQRAFMQCCWINVQAPRPLSLLFPQGSVHSTDFSLTQDRAAGSWGAAGSCWSPFSVTMVPSGGCCLQRRGRCKWGKYRKREKPYFEPTVLGNLTPFSISGFPSYSDSLPQHSQVYCHKQTVLRGRGRAGAVGGAKPQKSRGFGVLLVPARKLSSPECSPSCQVTVRVLVPGAAPAGGTVWWARLNARPSISYPTGRGGEDASRIFYCSQLVQGTGSQPGGKNPTCFSICGIVSCFSTPNVRDQLE